MKISVLTAALAITAITFGNPLAYGAPPADDLVGRWTMSLDVANADNMDSYPLTPNEDFIITSHDTEKNLFKGLACNEDPDVERAYFSGALDGKNIYITSWDSLSFGTVNNALTEMNVINLHQSLNECDDSSNLCYDSENNSSTARVVATRVNSNPYDTCP